MELDAAGALLRALEIFTHTHVFVYVYIHVHVYMCMYIM